MRRCPNLNLQLDCQQGGQRIGHVADPQAILLIFAKAPVPGHCKTRLIPMLGEAGAARLAGQLLATTVEQACQAKLAPVQLWCAPDPRHPLFQQLAARYEQPLLQLYTQRGADLGARLQMAITLALAHAKRVVVIGTDCPQLDTEYLGEAFAALDKAPAALGPADDGGYVLLGLRRDTRPALQALFSEMPWGGAEVAALTRERMRDAGLCWAELPSLTDLDRPDDLRRCLARGALTWDD